MTTPTDSRPLVGEFAVVHGLQSAAGSKNNGRLAYVAKVADGQSAPYDDETRYAVLIEGYVPRDFVALKRANLKHAYDFTVRASPIYTGFGGFSIRPYKKGEIIYEEKPFVTFDLGDERHIGAMLSADEREVLMQVSQDGGAAVEALYPNPCFEKAAAINKIPMGNGRSAALYLNMCRFNHACVMHRDNNSYWKYDAVRKKHVLTASRDIAPDEEICLDFASELSLFGDQRRQVLEATWGIICNCSVCWATPSYQQRIELYNTLCERISDSGSKPFVEVASLGEEALAILTEIGAATARAANRASPDGVPVLTTVDDPFGPHRVAVLYDLFQLASYSQRPTGAEAQDDGRLRALAKRLYDARLETLGGNAAHPQALLEAHLLAHPTCLRDKGPAMSRQLLTKFA